MTLSRLTQVCEEFGPMARVEITERRFSETDLPALRAAHLAVLALRVDVLAVANDLRCEIDHLEAEQSQ